jgi:NADH dehydrogenase
VRDAKAGRRKVVIVGGGFGGLTAARELKGADVDVTLVDPTSHHLFQPLLYQLACGGLSTGECASPIRAAVKHSSNTTVLMAKATGLDAERRQITLDRGETLDYDSLIVACGAETSYFGKDEWRDVSFSLKTLADAVQLRNQIYSAFEEAERTEDPVEREQWLTFVVIGGGPTGVELAGELAIIANDTMKGYFERIQPAKARVILLDAGERVTAAFSEKLSRKVAGYLAALGVTVRQGARVTSIDRQGATVQIDGAEERIDAKTVVWAAGVQAVGFAKTLAEATGAETDRAGRVQIGADLTVPGHPEIFAIGDATQVGGPDNHPLPGLATVSIQQARYVAKAIKAGAKGGPDAAGKVGATGETAPFKYFDKGALAVVGRGKAVCEIRGHKLSGRLAFFTYLTVHMYYLSGGGPGHRVKVLIDWISARVGDPQNQVIDEGLMTVDHPPPDAVS